jgi:glutaredoxin 3
MDNVKILTTETCSYCVAAKNLLQRQGITYQEIDLTTGGDQALALLSRSGQRTVPQIFINEQPIGGFTELSNINQ